ncbi:MAG: hypothetical protein KF861_16550 [Planctomycetaceae bacterium]|nr:hypothetical protein [Planctomycetaceae bacterium]
MPTTDGDPIELDCPHCGAVVQFPAGTAGRVDVCTECFKYVDVPSDFGFRGCVTSSTATPSLKHELKFEASQGLPRPQWDVYLPELYREVPESDLDAALTEAVRYWLTQLGAACGPGYNATESESFHLLSCLDERQAARVVHYCEDTLSRILQILSGIAADEGYGPHVVLAFDSAYLYYRYVARYYPEGKFGGSAGVFLSDDGYKHVAIQFLPHDWHRTLTHELVHSTLSHRPLPMWLDEGLTMLVESHLTGTEPVTINGEIRSRLREYWRTHSLESFWSGESFAFDDDGQELSYALAFIVSYNLSLAAKQNLHAFVCHAHRRDAGRQACEDVIGKSLGAIFSQTLGDGDWTPRGGYGDELQRLRGVTRSS